MPHPTPTPRPRGFTLIEVLVVVAIIIILLSFVVAIGAAVKRSSAEKTTKTTLDALRLAMSEYIKDHPEPNKDNWLNALKADPKIASAIAHLNGMPNEVDDGYTNKIVYIPSTDLRRTAMKSGVFQSFGANEKDEYGKTGSDDLLSDPIAP